MNEYNLTDDEFRGANKMIIAEIKASVVDILAEGGIIFYGKIPELKLYLIQIIDKMVKEVVDDPLERNRVTKLLQIEMFEAFGV